MKTVTHVEDLMTEDVVLLSVEQLVSDARHLMMTMGIHGIPVIDENGVVVGIVTSHDMTDELSGSEPLSEVMSEWVVTIESGASLSEAAELMKSQLIHHLVVTDHATPVGILSSFDFLDAFVD